MPRIFQHIEKGDKLGKVTRLKYIDDISDPDMTLYYFEDGTYCNSEFIAPYDTQDPLNSRKAMIEVASPTSLWQFKKREKIELDTEKKIAQGNDGTLYEAPPELSKDGREISKDEALKDEYDVMRMPRIPTNYKQEPDDDYLLSQHPELESQTSSSVTKTLSSNNNSFIKKKNSNVATPVHRQGTEDFDFDDEETNNVQIATNNVVAKKSFSSTKEFEEMSKEISDLRAENEKLRQQLKDAQSNADIYIIPDEDPFIKNMVTKSKKKTCKITLGIKFDLPPKEVYDTIKNAYEEGMAEKFVSSLTARIPRQSLLDSLNQGLTKFYEGKPSTNSSENKSTEKQK